MRVWVGTVVPGSASPHGALRTAPQQGNQGSANAVNESDRVPDIRGDNFAASTG